MGKTVPVQGSDGRFEGSRSIGDGKTRIPTASDVHNEGVNEEVPSTHYNELFDVTQALLPRGETPQQETKVPTVAIYEVGGYVRDELLGVQSKDIDFSVEAESFEAMRDFLAGTGFTIFLESPEYLTIRARFPKTITHPAIPPRFAEESKQRQLPTADFVLARKETTYTDGRHPDEVLMGSILDDLARRDFTVNAIARDRDGNYIDPHDGRGDLEKGILRAVGNPDDRIREDALRALRAIRFSITKKLTPDEALWNTLQAEWLPPLLASVSTSRKEEELKKAFHHDTVATLDVLYRMQPAFREAVFTDGLWLLPSQKQ